MTGNPLDSWRRARIQLCLAALVALVAPMLALTGPATAAEKFSVTVQQRTLSAVAGQSVTIAGKVRPRAKGQVVLKVREGSKWRRVAAAKLKKSKFSFSRPVGVGVAQYRVLKSAKSGLKRGVSRTITVTGSPRPGFASVSVGLRHACALKHDGTAWCWGSDVDGAVGIGAGSTVVANPTRIGSGTWRSIRTGLLASCGVQSDGTLWCWGEMEPTQAGTLPMAGPPGTNPRVPKRMGIRSDWRDVSPASYGGCGTTTGNGVVCWTKNGNYEAGPGGTWPELVFAYNDWLSYDTGGRGEITGCGLRAVNQVWCRTIAGYGQKAGAWLSIDAGENGAHACGIAFNKTAWCFGSNSYGEAGPGVTSPDPRPLDGNTWQAVSAGAATSCGIRTDGSLWCWGANRNGVLGVAEDVVGTSSTPLRVGQDSDWESVDAGNGAACAIRTNGTIWCWGSVIGRATTSTLPVLI